MQGDFNCGNIEWSTMQVPEGVPNRRVQSQLLEIAQDYCLSQLVNIQGVPEEMKLIFNSLLL